MKPEFAAHFLNRLWIFMGDSVEVVGPVLQHRLQRFTFARADRVEKGIKELMTFPVHVIGEEFECARVTFCGDFDIET
jgi:hypothetical protein